MSEDTRYSEELARKIEDRSAVVGIIGLGYVGLPLAVEFAKAGYRVVAIDLDGSKVQALNEGRSYIGDVPTSDVQQVVQNGKLHATTGFEALREVDAISICVPTPLRKTKDPDISYIVSATESIADNFRPGQLVVLESTTYPGTTDEVILPRLEAGGHKAGVDFFLAFSPERVDPGNPTYVTANIPKVIGGVTPTCTQLATALYSRVIATVIPVSSPATAEMVKLLENTFRAVNIGMANELAIMCSKLGIDVWEVIEAAATKPFGFMPFYPGPGLGGHCIPIDPLYLSWKLKTLNYNARFIELASEINTSMPEYVLDLVADALNDQAKPLRGSRVLVLGVTYKRDVEDVRESPAIDIISLLLSKGARAEYHDPYIKTLEISEHAQAEQIASIGDLTEDKLREYDAVVIVTDHTTYDYGWIADHARLLVDTRNATKHLKERDNIRRL
ncbi:MAG TPA: nucleotide sugar dehydrogenase [Chloroflexia bacterium]|nr:nucleotide sugar dehydrogenase [Chloroflexia bacterium]